jgi:hypothetical protein
MRVRGRHSTRERRLADAVRACARLSPPPWHVQFLGACMHSGCAMLVTEFLELGDLWRALPLRNTAGERIFAWGKRWAWRQLGRGGGGGLNECSTGQLSNFVSMCSP